MPQLTLSETFRCPPERAFAAITDFAHAADFITGVLKMEILTDGGIGLGTRLRETRKMYGREATEEMEITGWDPPRSVTIEARSHGAHYLTTYTVTPTAEGAEVRLDFEARPLTLGAKILSVVFRRAILSVRNMLASDLAEVRSHAETGAVANDG